jgi:hypothetical protein
MDKFNIKILSHEWISNENTETDLCSHGKLELTIGEEIILNESDGDWTISTSVLQLLRCIEPNPDTETDFNPIMCCGMLLMLGCPIGLYFDLKHKNGKIVIRNIKKQYGTNDNEHVLYPKIVAEINTSDFAINILNLAKEVKSFFNNEPKKNLDDDMDKELWFEFWNEFNELYKNGIEKYNC